MATCDRCRWYEFFYDDDDGDVGTCSFPRERMPLCMQGVAQRERELAKGAATGCPTFEVKT